MFTGLVANKITTYFGSDRHVPSYTLKLLAPVGTSMSSASVSS